MSQIEHVVLWCVELLAAAALWLAYVALLDRHLSGWWRLAKKFRYAGQFTGTVWMSRTAMLRGLYLWPAPVVGANLSGLYLARTWPLSVLGFAPLLIPWSHVLVDRNYTGNKWWRCLIIAADPPVRLSLRPDILRAIQNVAGQWIAFAA